MQSKFNLQCSVLAIRGVLWNADFYSIAVADLKAKDSVEKGNVRGLK